MFRVVCFCVWQLVLFSCVLIVLVGCTFHVRLRDLGFFSLSVNCCFVDVCVLVGAVVLFVVRGLLLIAEFWWFDALVCLIWYGL